MVQSNAEYEKSAQQLMVKNTMCSLVQSDKTNTHLKSQRVFM